MRRAARRDETEAEIVAALEAVGAQVYRISQAGLPDLCVWYRRWVWLEVKSLTGMVRKNQIEQREFIERHGVPVVRTAQQALVAVGAISPGADHE